MNLIDKINNCADMRELGTLIEEIQAESTTEERASELQSAFIKRRAELCKRVDSLNDVDYSDIDIPLAVVYDSPIDFPGKVIARIWGGKENRPTDTYGEYETMEQCLSDAMAAGFTHSLGRCMDDDPHIADVLIR